MPKSQNSVGDMIREDIMKPSDLSTSYVAKLTGISLERIEAILEGSPIAAEEDLRLGRVFGLSEGYFMRVEMSQQLREASWGNRTALKALKRFRVRTKKPKAT